MEQIQELRQLFTEVLKYFDFHQCFHYAYYGMKEIDGSDKARFKLHQIYEMGQDYDKEDGVQVPKIQFAFILLSTICANAFIGCFTEIFCLSARFS